MIDLREQERVKAAPVIRYWTRDRNMMISQADNISESGICFNTGKQYSKGTPVYIQIRSPFKLNESITFKAEIMHQEIDETFQLYKTGAKIKDFHEDDNCRLSDYIKFMKDLKN
jgi:hypothetical protein